MLTGDHLLTAHAVADAINLPHGNDELFSGQELEKMPYSEKQAAYKKGTIFARLKPEQKLELVMALQSENKIVAMTGDGINDAPALKLADVGISMGERATDVAQSTAKLILLKNDFSGIGHSILEGKRVLKSLKESFGYLIAFHIPIILIALYQSLFLKTPILLPIHIVLMELIIHPVSAFVFVEEGPVNYSQNPKEFITRESVLWSSLRGLGLAFFSILTYYHSPGEMSSRSGPAVLALVNGNIGLLLGEKGGFFYGLKNSKAARLATVLLLALSFSLAFIPFLRGIFYIKELSPSLFLGILAIGAGLGLISKTQRQL
jgi:Ca2+-transporting ATPase